MAAHSGLQNKLILIIQKMPTRFNTNWLPGWQPLPRDTNVRERHMLKYPFILRVCCFSVFLVLHCTFFCILLSRPCTVKVKECGLLSFSKALWVFFFFFANIQYFCEALSQNAISLIACRWGVVGGVKPQVWVISASSVEETVKEKHFVKRGEFGVSLHKFVCNAAAVYEHLA